MRPALRPASRAFTQGLIYCTASVTRWSDLVPVSSQAETEARFWLSQLEALNGYPFRLPESYDSVVHVDASDEAWGAWCTTLQGTVESASLSFPIGVAEESSTLRELRGVLWGLQRFRGAVAGRSVLVRSDNQGVFYIIRKGGSSQPDLSLVCQQILSWCIGQGTSLFIDWVPREENEYADYLSHAVESNDWGLSKESFANLPTVWGDFTIDLFATPENTKLPRYATRYLYRGAPLLNAFTLNWATEIGYACPPPPLIAAVILHARKCKAQLVLVVPWWPSAYWWPRLRSSSGASWAAFVVQSVSLGKGVHCLVPGRDRAAYNGLGVLNSFMWALYCDFTKV